MSGKLYGPKHGRLIQVELDWAKCGTEGNYRGHLRRGEDPCGACRRAMARVRKERYSSEAQRQYNLRKGRIKAS